MKFIFQACVVSMVACSGAEDVAEVRDEASTPTASNASTNAPSAMFTDPTDPGPLPQSDCERDAAPVLLSESGFLRFDPKARTFAAARASCVLPPAQFPLIAVFRTGLLASIDSRWSLGIEEASNVCPVPVVLVDPNQNQNGYPVGMAALFRSGAETLFFLAHTPFVPVADPSQSSFRLVERKADGSVRTMPFTPRHMLSGLTGTGDGRLFASAEHSTAESNAAFAGFYEISPETGQTSRFTAYAGAALERSATRTPVVFWGGALWFFLSRVNQDHGTQARVTLRYDTATGRFDAPLALDGSAGNDARAAAVSTCAPLVAPR